MTGAHLHLMLSHVPVLGAVFGTGLLAIGVLRKSRALQQAALTVLVLAGLAAGATYLTGEGAEEALEGQIAGGTALEKRHEAAALLSLVLVAITALLGTVALLRARMGRPLARSAVAASLMMALVASGTFVWVANLGGQLGHPEIRSQEATRPVAESEREHER